MFTTDELNTTFRREVGDQVNPNASPDVAVDSDCLWKDDEIYGYATEAADALAKETEELFKIVQLAVVIGEQVVKLPRYVLKIRSARLVVRNRALVPQNTNAELYYVRSDYGLPTSLSMFSSTGSPTAYIRDYKRGALLLVPKPTEDDILELQCSVTLTTPLLAGMMLPFLDVEDQRLLLHYTKYLAYAKQDADTMDLKRSLGFKQQFDDGALARGLSLRKYRRGPGVVRMEW